ncbi:uncharacterized protein LOC132273590 isoform X2 [Cornus florida]|uniref:uncharacterized protein LOC132273590 isoform X2 n=1 Tax=Cornus florida TaxID=4283 RepID=UPI00289CD733|nr:uncharacterized protein LOC132273590 isoform X2 [Cornus florida]
MGSSEEEKLIQMVRDFIELDPSSPISPTSFKPIQFHHQPTHLISLQDILGRVTDGEIEILEKILLYLKDMEHTEQTNNNNIKEWIVLKLKMDSYEASLCKTTWVTTFGRPSGDYEYIDVMMKDDRRRSDETVRLIVDMDFKSQFELARPTSTYSELSNALPSIFVGTEEKLNNIISLLCSAAKQSLKERGLHIPPWRKASYMHSKWLSENCKRVSVSGSPNRELVVGVPKCEPKSGTSICGSSEFGKWVMVVKP